MSALLLLRLSARAMAAIVVLATSTRGFIFAAFTFGVACIGTAAAAPARGNLLRGGLSACGATALLHSGLARPVIVCVAGMTILAALP
eukprot:CAMPEP_0118995612 /NCGR_PEP_ID=MMETSP1173-20130426/58762_1 /TAXON_ID=1034831 /ORGANISM="Rhizochromulina marina cf, Strain CCMP1243" /LENGTH=87 /DNA_ID=CAMNT_0006946957 /DNA_START=174 /DNA_END=437 /DNA_ORIENTATION=-